MTEQECVAMRKYAVQFYPSTSATRNVVVLIQWDDDGWAVDWTAMYPRDESPSPGDEKP